MSDDFITTVHVIDSRFSVDLDEMLLLRNKICASAEELALAAATLDEAAYAANVVAQCDYDVAKISGEIGYAHQQLCVDMGALYSLADKIGMCLLIYLAAEGRAKAFSAVRSQIFPEDLSIVDIGELSKIPVPGGLFLPLISFPHVNPFRRHNSMIEKDQLAALVLPFVLGMGGTKSDSLAAALYFNQLARSKYDPVIVGVLKLARDGFSSSQGSSFFPEECLVGFQTSTSCVPQVSSVLATLSSGLSFLINGKAGGVAYQGSIVTPEGKLIRVAHIIPPFLASPSTKIHYSDSVREKIFASKELKGAPVTLTPTPVTPSALVQRVSRLESAQRHGQFEILRHDTQGKDGHISRSWTVVVRGTQRWDVGGENPQDLHTNLQSMARIESEQTGAIRAAMEDVGIAPGEPVEFVGHSQGGMISAQLASDPQIQADYNVAGVLAVGAPTGAYSPPTSPEGQGVLNVENLRDLVPALDGEGHDIDAKNSTSVYFDSDRLGTRSSFEARPFAHDINVYIEALERIESGNDPHLKGFHEWVDKRHSAMGFTENTRTLSMTFNTQRVHP